MLTLHAFATTKVGGNVNQSRSLWNGYAFAVEVDELTHSPAPFHKRLAYHSYGHAFAVVSE